MLELRTCRVCNKTKDKESMALGNKSKVTGEQLYRKTCSECYNKWWRNFFKNPEKRKRKIKIQKKYRDSNKEKLFISNRLYKMTIKGKESAIRATAKQRKKPDNRKKEKARHKIYHLINNGKIKRGKCIRCNKKAQAHHPDYSKPLEIAWLCPKHHKEVHMNLLKIKKENICSLEFAVIYT